MCGTWHVSIGKLWPHEASEGLALMVTGSVDPPGVDFCEHQTFSSFQCETLARHVAYRVSSQWSSDAVPTMHTSQPPSSIQEPAIGFPVCWLRDLTFQV